MSDIQRYDFDKAWGIEKNYDGIYVEYDDHVAIVAQLESQLAEAKKDQARYKWLRDKANSTKEAAPLVFFTDDTCKPTWQNVLHSADLDCAIDAAIKEQGK